MINAINTYNPKAVSFQGVMPVKVTEKILSSKGYELHTLQAGNKDIANVVKMLTEWVNKVADGRKDTFWEKIVTKMRKNISDFDDGFSYIGSTKFGADGKYRVLTTGETYSQVRNIARECGYKDNKPLMERRITNIVRDPYNRIYNKKGERLVLEVVFESIKKGKQVKKVITDVIFHVVPPKKAKSKNIVSKVPTSTQKPVQKSAEKPSAQATFDFDSQYQSKPKTKGDFNWYNH